MMLGTKYIVQENDTLWDLSNKFLKDPNKWPLIFSHNNSSQVVKKTGSSINIEDVIYVGQVLFIPDLQIKAPSKPVKYIHFKSKAKEYEKYKNSIFLKGTKAPITKISVDELAEFKKMPRSEREYAVRLKLARKISDEKINIFFNKVDSIPELVGAGVIYMDKNFTLVKIRPSIRQDKLQILLREVNKYDQFMTVAQPSSNRRVLMELLYAGLSCSGAALGYVAIMAEGLGTSVTFGGSAILIPVTTAATLASTASCGVYTGRVINELSGNSKSNDFLDGSDAYNYIMYSLDVISLAGVAASIKSGSTLLKQLTSKNLSKQSLLQKLKSMPRADRKRLIKEIIKVDHRDISNQKLKLILKSMDAPKVFSQAQVRKAMIGELTGAIGSAFSTGASVADGATGEVFNRIALAFIADEQKD